MSGSYSAILEEEYRSLEEHIKSAGGGIILYGNTTAAAALTIAFRDLGITDNIAIFDRGSFVYCDGSDLSENADVILCGLTAVTRESMRKDAERYFPLGKCFEFLPVYYHWITRFVKRSCDHNKLAETLLLSREDKAISNISVMNTTFCTLKCKNCSVGIPYIKDKHSFAADQQAEWVAALTDSLPVSYLNIMGGEPLIDKNFPELVRRLAENPKVMFMDVVTNATVLPSEEAWEAIRKAGAVLRISDYGELSVRIDEIKEKAAERSVPCIIYPKAKTWLQFGEMKAHNRSEAFNKDVARKCMFGTHCLMLYNGKLFCCVRSFFFDSLRNANEAVISNTLDVSNFTDEELLSFINGDSLHAMCDYCDWPMREVAPGEQL